MPAAAKLALFAVLLAAAFGLAAVAGGAIDPEGAEPTTASAGGHGAEEESHGAAPATDGAALPGLAAEQDGLRLVLDDPQRARADRRAPISFRVLDADGHPVTDFDVEHEKRMHLIVVRRDLRGFQHLHPEMAADGTWSTTADLGRPGTHRVYADFSVGEEKRTLGTDLHVAGAYRPAAVPATSTVSRDGDLEVRLRRDGGRFAFSVLRDGRPVDDELEDYLGAKGHLVTLRTADLAYLHTHPDGDRLAFDTDLPSAGTYRLWVQFQLDGEVHTAAFTQEVTS